jgi:hypothetical protein
MKRIAGWFKSRTINWAAVVAVAGAIQMNMASVQAFIPTKYYGLSLVGVATLMAYLRVTHKTIPNDTPS